MSIPIDLATPSEVTKLKAGTHDAKDDAPLAGKPKEPKPEAVKEAEPKKPERDRGGRAEKPEPSRSPRRRKPKRRRACAQARGEEARGEACQAEAGASRAEKARAAEAKRDFNADRIAALLNKIPDAANEAAARAALRGAAPKKVNGQSNGTEMTMSVNEIDALRARIAQCWSPPPGGLGAEQIVVQAADEAQRGRHAGRLSDRRQ